MSKPNILCNQYAEQTGPAMDTYITVREVLENVREFEEQMRGLYLQQAERAERQDVKCFLQHLGKLECRHEKGLANYEDEERKMLLDNWLQYGPDEEQLQVPKLEDFPADMDMNQAESLAVKQNGELATYYSQVAERSSSREVSELFGKLVDQVESENRDVRKEASSIRHHE